MGLLKKQMRLGVLLSVGLPIFLLGFVFLFLDMQRELTLTTFSRLAALCVLPNGVLFFLALRKNNDSYAYGILLGCIFWALLTLGITFFR